MKWTLLK